jgi:hypothetical protein
MKRVLIISLFLLNVWLLVFVFAGWTAETIHIQVRAYNGATGQKPVDGAMRLVVRIYDAPQEGNLMWTAQFPAAVFRNGVFDGEIGNSTNPLPEIVFSSSSSSYLETEINGEAQSRRGIIKASTASNKSESIHTDAYLQPGAFAFFDLPQCPAGWSEYTLARGRYIVGKNQSGTPGSLVGTALTDLENRPVGIHNHSIHDPGHSHTCYNEVGCNAVEVTNPDTYSALNNYIQISYSATGITVLNNNGSIAGTNAPYAQYILCVLNQGER